MSLKHVVPDLIISIKQRAATATFSGFTIRLCRENMLVQPSVEREIIGIPAHMVMGTWYVY